MRNNSNDAVFADVEILANYKGKKIKRVFGSKITDKGLFDANIENLQLDLMAKGCTDISVRIKCIRI